MVEKWLKWDLLCNIPEDNASFILDGMNKMYFKKAMEKHNYFQLQIFVWQETNYKLKEESNKEVCFLSN